MASAADDALLPAAHAITASDHGGIVTITAGTCLVVVTLFLLSRLVLKWPVSCGLYGDDYAAIAATVC